MRLFSLAMFLGCNFEAKCNILTKYYCWIVVKISCRPGSKHHFSQETSWFLWTHSGGKLDAFLAVSWNRIYVAIKCLIFMYHSFLTGFLIRVGLRSPSEKSHLSDGRSVQIKVQTRPQAGVLKVQQMLARYLWLENLQHYVYGGNNTPQ